MHKRTIVMLAVLMFAFCTPLYAEEGTVLDLGIKGWWNEWKQDGPDGSITSDSVVLLGPEFSVKFSNGIFLEASYLFSTTDYRFTDITVTNTVEREDLDLVFGYLFVPEFGIVTGYRTLWFRDHAGLKQTVYGPILGIRAQGPLGHPLSLYAKADYQFTKFEETDEFGTFRENSPGWIGEAGVKIDFSRIFSMSAGYKYETNKGNTSQVKDTFTGVTFGAFFSL